MYQLDKHDAAALYCTASAELCSAVDQKARYRRMP